MMQPTSGCAWGWCVRGSESVYVSRGIGLTMRPFRFLAPPEVAIVDYVSAPKSAATEPATHQRRRPEEV